MSTLDDLKRQTAAEQKAFEELREEWEQLLDRASEWYERTDRQQKLSAIIDRLQKDRPEAEAELSKTEPQPTAEASADEKTGRKRGRGGPKRESFPCKFVPPGGAAEIVVETAQKARDEFSPLLTKLGERVATQAPSRLAELLKNQVDSAFVRSTNLVDAEALKQAEANVAKVGRTDDEACRVWTALQVLVNGPPLLDAASAAAPAAAAPRAQKLPPAAERGVGKSVKNLGDIEVKSCSSAVASDAPWNDVMVDVAATPLREAASGAEFIVHNRLDGARGSLVIIQEPLYQKWAEMSKLIEVDRSKLGQAFQEQIVLMPPGETVNANRFTCSPAEKAQKQYQAPVTFPQGVRFVRTAKPFGLDFDAIGKRQFEAMIGTLRQPLAAAYYFSIGQLTSLVNLVRRLQRIRIVHGELGTFNALTAIYSGAPDFRPNEYVKPLVFGLDFLVKREADLKLKGADRPILQPRVTDKGIGVFQCSTVFDPSTEFGRYFDLIALETALLNTPTFVGPDGAQTDALYPADIMLFEGFGSNVIPATVRTPYGAYPAPLTKCVPSGSTMESVRRLFLIRAYNLALEYFCPLSPVAMRVPSCVPSTLWAQLKHFYIVRPGPSMFAAVSYWSPDKPADPTQWSSWDPAATSIPFYGEFSSHPIPEALDLIGANACRQTLDSKTVEFVQSVRTLMRNEASADAEAAGTAVPPIEDATFAVLPPGLATPSDLGRRRCVALGLTSGSFGNVQSLPWTIGLAAYYLATVSSSKPSVEIALKGDDFKTQMSELGAFKDARDMFLHIDADFSVLCVVQALPAGLRAPKQLQVVWESRIPIGYRAAMPSLPAIRTFQDLLANPATLATPTAPRDASNADFEGALETAVFRPLLTAVAHVLTQPAFRGTLNNLRIVTLWRPVARAVFLAIERTIKVQFVSLSEFSAQLDESMALVQYRLQEGLATPSQFFAIPVIGWMILAIAAQQNYPFASPCSPQNT